MESSVLKPHVSSWGYAFFLTVNATSLWGGIFPFLPVEFQTAEVTLTFFLAQALSFWGAFCASAFGSYFFPREARRMMVSLSALLVFFGSACLIGAMYLVDFTLILVAGGGVLLGIGCAGMFMLWQRYFASLPSERGNLRLIVGTALAPLSYFALYLVPIALTAYLIPLVFVPLCGLCVALSVREMKTDQPMFEDVPRQHPRIYRRVLKNYWRAALCVGSLAFASGVIRGIALLHEEISMVVNVSSMLGALISAVVLLVLWFRISFRFSLASVFRVAYPVLVTGFLLLPFLGSGYLNIFAAVTYMIFSLVLMLMMMQCAQISRDRGINPVFIYAFFGMIVYLMQSLGFLLGWLSESIDFMGFDQLALITTVSGYVLGMTLFAASGTLFKQLSPLSSSEVDPIEFLPLEAHVRQREQPDEGVEVCDAAPMGVDKGKRKARRNRPSTSRDYGIIRDRISKQCFALKDLHGLSSRETEVMELIARGNSMAAIAERLFISENTVRTHSKHIYAKLNIHKRQDLLDMLGQLSF